MNMKNLLLPAMFAAALMPGTLPLSAATQADSYPAAEAKGLIGDDGTIFFAYADGWDKFSQKRCKTLLESKAIRKAAGKAVLIPLPIPAYTTEENKQKRADICGKLQVPGAPSYPALIMLDRSGKHYATLCGSEVIRAKDSEVAALLADLLAKGRERTRLLTEAEKATGPEKAKLTFDAYQIDGLSGFGKGFGGHIAKLDPQDATGANRAANYNHYGLIDELNKLSTEELVAKVDKLLADPAYTDRQKQQMCVAAIGVLRRKSGPENMDHMGNYTKRMKAYAPETPEGKTAGLILRDWVCELSCESGWSPGCLPSDSKPVELKGKLPIDGPGTYTVTFTYTKGRKALNITAVELYDGQARVAEDRHNGTTGDKTEGNVYTLTVGAAIKDPHIFITFNMKDRDSHGKIEVKKQ